MVKNVVVIGSQWGDEGKGKVVDWLTECVDVVIRFQGGHNAGHTLVIDGVKTALNLVPSGILHADVACLIGPGVVLSPDVLLQELDKLQAQGLSVVPRLKVSEGAPLLLPSHARLDILREKQRGKGAIGTTGRGIGPAYEDKVARRGLRVGDLRYPEHMKTDLKTLLDYHNFLIKHYYNDDPLSFEQIYDALMHQADRLLPMITELTTLLREYTQAGKRLLFEGAQGAMLDIDHGTYPYVTSSNTTAGGAATGTGLGPHYLDTVLGVTKAYSTRVGAGPMPTELFDAVGHKIATRGHEIGTNTGRPRRCGWLDMCLLRKSIQINSLTALCVTKLDVLDTLEHINICTHYRLDGKLLDIPPNDVRLLTRCEPVYITCSGWLESTLGATTLDQLPAAARDYLAQIESLAQTPIHLLSTGPERRAMAVIQHPFAN